MDSMQEVRSALLEAFPGSFINDKGEFIAHRKSNQYFNLSDCKTPLDVDCKVLEWFSRAAYKTEPYSQEWRNNRFHRFMLNGINDFLGTDFAMKSMEIIYAALGNAVNHEKTVRFIESNYDFSMFHATR